jgi:invasion protein IalB
MSVRSKIFLSLIAMLTVAGTGSVLAQDEASAPAQQAAMQPSVSKQFDDWQVRCFPRNSPSPCDMYELLADKNTNQRVLGISIAYVPSANVYALQLGVPLGVDLQKGVVISTDGYKSPVLKYRRCDSTSCYVEMVIDTAAITALRNAKDSGKVAIVFDGGKAMEWAFSLKGFSAAHNSMVDLAKEKATGSAPAAGQAQ